jgi:hypothetical protein
MAGQAEQFKEIEHDMRKKVVQVSDFQMFVATQELVKSL